MNAETFLDIDRLNDTGGVTGINHIFENAKRRAPVDETILTGQAGCTFLYNLWLEIPESRRWSVNFFGRKNSPDAIIVSKPCMMGLGSPMWINSFDKFDPDYLLKKQGVPMAAFRPGARSRHLGRGIRTICRCLPGFMRAVCRWESIRPCFPKTSPNAEHCGFIQRSG
ncbi:MAG: hypothetical protein R2875_15925 [Desulfobacterales bacterium]